MAEAAGEAGSIVTDYQYEQNTYSDSQFLKNHLEKESGHTEPAVIVTDGAYSGTANEELAAGKNVQLVTTNLTGREAQDIAADFEFNEDGTKVEKCAGGFGSKSCSYNPKTGQCTASFHRSQCEQCPHKAQCRPKTFKRTCRKTISANTKRHTEQQRYRGTEEFSRLSSFRNGVEAIPSMLRRKYHVDHMPVRGLIRSRFFFGCKISALNFGKFCRYMQGCKSLAPNTAMA